MSTNGLSIQFKVAESMQSDVGRNIIRLDSKAREKLNVTSGDIVELRGKRTTVAVVWQSRPQDEGLNVIRMDGYIRQNAGVGIGDKIIVRKADLKEANKVVLAPNQAIKYSPGFDDYIKKRLVGRAIARGDTIFIAVFGTSFPLVATVVQPNGTAIITEKTEVTLKKEPIEQLSNSSVTYDDIGGLKEEVKKIREMVELPLRHPELFERLGIEPPKGILIYGAPGTGKTLLAKAVANESDAHFISIAGPELVTGIVGKSEQKLREIFKEAQENSPSIIFMDEFDAFASKRDTSGEVEKRMVSQLLTLLDGLKTRGQIIVIGATNMQNSIDPALRRPGRFDRELEIGIPNRDSRKEILQIHMRNMPLADDVDLDELANLTHGYTGADIESLSKESAMEVLRRILPDIDLQQEFIPSEILDDLKVTRTDTMDAMKEIRPSALREVFIEKPNVKWDDIGGLTEIKREIKEAIELPLKHPEVFKRIGIRPVRGILLIGLPGTGKTMIAKATATESEINFISIKGPEIVDSPVGESEKKVREIFRKARQASPCVIFIDEIDAIASRRNSGPGPRVIERIVDSLLTEMDGVTNIKDVLVMAATNRPDILDPGLLRPGRFDKIIKIPLPDEDVRLSILKIHVREMPLGDDVNLNELVKQTDGFTGADIENLCREAGMVALRESVDIKLVTNHHFDQAFENVRPSATKQLKEMMDQFKKGDESMFR